MVQHGVFGWLLIGIATGVLGKFLLPGREPGGCAVTILIGIAGALLAGYVAHYMGWRAGVGWRNHAAATVGAIVLLIVYRVIVARRG